MKNTPEMKSFYLNILINLGIYSRIDEKQFDTILKRYNQLGGNKPLIYKQVKRKLKKYGL